MIFIWISFALFWLYSLFARPANDTMWLGLFFLWVLLAIHYIKTYRKWKEIDRTLRKTRLMQYSENFDEVEDET